MTLTIVQEYYRSKSRSESEGWTIDTTCNQQVAIETSKVQPTSGIHKTSLGSVQGPDSYWNHCTCIDKASKYTEEMVG